MAAASTTGGRGPPAVLEFLVINFNVCLMSLSNCIVWFQVKPFQFGKVKGKVFPYSLPSVGPGADPGVQAVSPQMT